MSVKFINGFYAARDKSQRYRFNHAILMIKQVMTAGFEDQSKTLELMGQSVVKHLKEKIRNGNFTDLKPGTKEQADKNDSQQPWVGDGTFLESLTHETNMGKRGISQGFSVDVFAEAEDSKDVPRGLDSMMHLYNILSEGYTIHVTDEEDVLKMIKWMAMNLPHTYPEESDSSPGQGVVIEIPARPIMKPALVKEIKADLADSFYEAWAHKTAIVGQFLKMAPTGNIRQAVSMAEKAQQAAFRD